MKCRLRTWLSALAKIKHWGAGRDSFIIENEVCLLFVDEVFNCTEGLRGVLSSISDCAWTRNASWSLVQETRLG